MRQSVIVLIITLFATASTAKKATVIEHPLWLSDNTGSTLTVTKVELTDTATVLSFHSKHKPKNWIRIMPSATLTGEGGRRYAARCGIGIRLGAKFHIPESGEADFKISFEPMPRDTRYIDFMESPKDWKIWGIHRRGDKPAGEHSVPTTDEAALATTDESGFFRRGTGVVRGRFEGKRPALMEYSGYEALFQTSTPMVFDVADDGTFTAVIPLECPILSYLQYDNGYCHFYLSAGDTIDVTIDQNNTIHYKDGTKNTNLLRLLSNYFPKMGIDYRKLKAESDSCSFREITDRIAEGTARQLRFADYLAKRWGLNREETHLLKTKTRLECCWYINEFEWNYDNFTPGETLKANNYTFMRKMGFEDLTCLSLPFELYFMLNRYEYCDIMRYQKPDDVSKRMKTTADNAVLQADEAIFGLGRPSLFLQLSWIQTNKYRNNAEDGRKDSALINSRKRLMTYTHLRNLLDEQQMKDNEARTALYTLPEGQATDIFDSIMRKYRGKMVYVDFWATTCGPCVAAIKHSQQLRDSIATLADTEIVFVTNDRQSPEKACNDFTDRYLKGEECVRIPYNDWLRLTALFKFTGIPHYELVAPDGRVFTDNRQYLHLNFTDFKNIKDQMLKAATENGKTGPTQRQGRPVQ